MSFSIVVLLCGPISLKCIATWSENVWCQFCRSPVWSNYCLYHLSHNSSVPRGPYHQCVELPERNQL